MGANFHVPLRLALSSMAEMTVDDEVFIPDEQLPDLPGELCGIWAYIQWEAANCPNRSQQDSDAAYQHAIQVWHPSLSLSALSLRALHKNQPDICLTAARNGMKALNSLYGPGKQLLACACAS